jgi:hypothetical protein
MKVRRALGISEGLGPPPKVRFRGVSCWRVSVNCLGVSCHGVSCHGVRKVGKRCGGGGAEIAGVVFLQFFVNVLN